jgi:hypothetical protein
MLPEYQYAINLNVGVILAVRNIVSTVSGTAWGSYADFSGKHGFLFKVSWICGLIPAAGLFAEFALLSSHISLLFWLLLATVGVYGLFNSPKEIFMTTATLDILGRERHNEWGKIRAWYCIMSTYESLHCADCMLYHALQAIAGDGRWLCCIRTSVIVVWGRMVHRLVPIHPDCVNASSVAVWYTMGRSKEAHCEQ